MAGVWHCYWLLEEVRMTLATTVTHYTPEDLLALPEYGRFELIDGQLVERKMGAKSSLAATNLLGLVWYFVRSNNLGLVFQADCGYQIFAEAPGRVRFADGSFIRHGKLPEELVPEGHCRVTPDLVIEAVSPNDTAYEVEDKIAQWLGANVRLVWVIYPETQRVQVHRADGTVTKLQSEEQLLGEDVLPGFQSQIAEIFQGL
jgi:Uma2 family endonuclease